MTDINAEIDDIVRAWLADEDGAGDRLMALRPIDRVEALCRLGYDTPSHWAMFGVTNVDRPPPAARAALAAEGNAAVEGLIGAMLHALAVCDRGGHNLPEMIAAALTEIADRFGSERLVEHRPGSWEADHIRALDLSELLRDAR